jgi:hypothetical protein
MKKTIILSIAAVAVLFVSLALNTNVNTSTSNVNLGQLMQNANAEPVYWAHTYCADPFGSSEYFYGNSAAVWQNGQYIDCPFDNKAYRVRVCYAGGGAACTLDETQTTTSTTWVSTGEGGYYTTTTSTQALGQRWNVGNSNNIHKANMTDYWDPAANYDYQIIGVNHLVDTPWDRDFNTTVGYTGYDPQYQ